MIEVTIVQRAPDHIMTLARSLISVSKPIHKHSIVEKSAMRNFAPTDWNVASRSNEFFNTANEVAFEFDVLLVPLLFHNGLAFDAVMPVVGENFVAANVNIFARKKFEDFGKNVLQERICLFVANAINAVEDASGKIGLEWAASATELRIGSQSRR